MPQHGVSGNRPLWGVMQTGEHITKLTGSSGQAIWHQMRLSDGQVAAVLKAINMPIVANAHPVDPASDDPLDIEIAEFIEDNLARRMSMTWRDTMRHVMLMLPHGFMAFEKLWMRGEDGLIRLKKLDPRLPWSVDRWNYDGDSLASIEQVGSDGKRYVLPIDKLVIFTHNREGDNWEGISALRPIYGYWYVKNILMSIAAIKHERHGVGLPIATAPEGIDSTDPRWTAMEDLLEEIHADERGYMVIPSGWDVKLLEAAHKGGTDTEAFIQQLDHKMATTMLAQFLQLGTTDSGSRALGESFIDFFMDAVQEVDDYICDVLNRFVIRELVDYNWEVDEYPTIRAGRIRKLDRDVVGALITAGVITKDADVENSVRVQLGLPERSEEEVQDDPSEPVAEEPEEPVEDEEPEEEPEADPESDPEETEASDHLHTFAAALPGDLIDIVDPIALSDQLDRARDDALSLVLKTREAQVSRVIAQIVGGKRVRDIVVPAKKDMYDDLVHAFREQVRAGKEQAREEILRQRPDLRAADPMPAGDFIDLLLEELSLLVDGAAEKLKSVVGRLALELQKAGYKGADLQAELERMVYDRLGEQTWKDLVGDAINTGWGHGRGLALVEYGEEVAYYYRSGILDKRLCRVCGPRDQMRVTPEMTEFRVPDQECEGGPNRCRCLVVAVMAREGQRG